jgi:hypothetical protein
VQVGEADGERIDTWMFFGELNADFFRVVPIECWRHGFS